MELGDNDAIPSSTIKKTAHDMNSSMHLHLNYRYVRTVLSWSSVVSQTCKLCAKYPEVRAATPSDDRAERTYVSGLGINHEARRSLLILVVTKAGRTHYQHTDTIIIDGCYVSDCLQRE